MIFALRHPAVLLGLLLGFLLGIALRAAAQRRLAGAGGTRGLRATTARGLPAPRAGWAAYLDPYGTVGAVLGGAGWGPRPPYTRRRNADLLALLAALVVHAALAAAGFALFVAAGGTMAAFQLIDVSDLVRGQIAPTDVSLAVPLGFAVINVACGLLALVPIPPLELGVVLWGRLPRTPGARRFAYHLLDEQWGVGVVLVLLLLPLGGNIPVLLAVIDAIAHPILTAF